MPSEIIYLLLPTVCFILYIVSVIALCSALNQEDTTMTYWTVPADPRPTDDSERFEWEPNCYRVLGHRNFTAIWGSPLGEFDTKEAALEFIKTVKSLDQDDDGFIELTLHEQLTNIRTGQTSEDLIKSFEFNPETGVWE